MSLSPRLARFVSILHAIGGDRECDIAMTELFGGFQPEFYQGYESVMPLLPNYHERKDIYNLYHILNHCNLFGGHYLEQAQLTIHKIISY